MKTDTAVITGLGIVAPTGVGVEDYWDATLRGRTALSRISRFDASGYRTQVAGTITGLDPATQVAPALVPQTDRWTQLALVAGQLALDDAGLDPTRLDEFAGAVVTSSSSGGTEFGQHEMTRLYQKGPGHVGAYQSIAWFYAATTGQLSIRHGMRGASGVIAAEQAGGLIAIDRARHLVTGGDPEVRVVVTGGTDSAMCPYALVAEQSGGRLTATPHPEVAYHPFAADSRGHVPGEGGAIIIIEQDGWRPAGSADRTYAAVLGAAWTFDPPPGTGRPSTYERAIRDALDVADVPAGEIDAIWADAAGSPQLDHTEATAIRAVFGTQVPVTAPKAGTGRLYGGGASLDVACAALAIRDGALPPFPPTVRPLESHGLDFVTGQARTQPLDHVMVLARGYGGFNAAMVLASYQPPTRTV